jgi:hypothetical protein
MGANSKEAHQDNVNQNQAIPIPDLFIEPVSAVFMLNRILPESITSTLTSGLIIKGP